MPIFLAKGGEERGVVVTPGLVDHALGILVSLREYVSALHAAVQSGGLLHYSAVEIANRADKRVLHHLTTAPHTQPHNKCALQRDTTLSLMRATI